MLALVPIYGSVQNAALRLFARDWTLAQRAIPIVALFSLFLTFVANVVPIPPGIAARYPAFAIVWIALGALVLRPR